MLLLTAGCVSWAGAEQSVQCGATATFIVSDSGVLSRQGACGTDCTYLDLFSRSINLVNVSAFQGCTSLRTVSLSFNDLTSIPSGLFEETTALWALDLSYNKISSIASDAFVNLHSLSSLYLSSNKLTTLPEEIFNITTLSLLTLASNEIVSSVPQQLFQKLCGLIYLSLDTAILFSTLMSLRSLYLKNNSLSGQSGVAENFFYKLVVLKFLTLDNFDGSFLQRADLKNLSDTLDSLSLYDVLLSSIQEGTF